MNYLKFLIIIGQLGRIWTKSYKARRIYQTLTALGFFSLFMTKSNSTNNERKIPTKYDKFNY